MKIICIGKNYAEHIKELNSITPVEPVFFMKPETALIKDDQPFYLPDFSNDLHHEVEVVLRISKPGKHIALQFAHNYYNEITVGIDFTARDLQQQLKEKGLPWEKAKAFDGSAPVGKFMSKKNYTDIGTINFHLQVNGKTTQKGNVSDMIFSFDKIVAYVSQFVTLKTGDLIFTGTPHGVGPVKIGDKLEVFIEDQRLLAFDVK